MPAPKTPHANAPRIHPLSRKEWRKWLTENHDKESGVWVIFYKKHTGKKEVTYADAVEEALCFGWIDSTPNKIDDDTHMQYFSPRKPKSVWSKVNKTRIEKLIKDGLMMPAGIQKIEQAKKDGSWTLLDKVEEYIMPEDLEKALRKNATARKYFEAFPPSVKKGLYWWIESAKREETRNHRVKTVVEMAALNQRANEYKKKT